MFTLVTNSLTDSCLVNLIDITLPCEDAKSKLVDVVTLADEDRVGNNLLQILKLRFGKKIKLLFRLGQFFLLMFCKGYMEILVEILKLGFVKILNLRFSGDADV